jgi:hypothetical protein
MKPFRAYHIIGWLTVLGYIVLFSLLAYWVHYPYDVLTFNSIEIQNTVRAGEVLVIKWDFCKHTNQPGVIHRALHDTYVYQISTAYTSTPKGCFVQMEQIATKEFMPAGTYRYVATACYNVNPIREVCVNYETPAFEIID